MSRLLLSKVKLITPCGQNRSYASSSISGGSSALVQAGIVGNFLLTGYLIYHVTTQDSKAQKMQESLDFGMDRIDECLNRIDLRNNETTGYFEKVSAKVEQLEKLEKKKK